MIKQERRKFLGIQLSKFNEKGERQPWWRLPEKWHKHLELKQMFGPGMPPYRKWRFIYNASIGLILFNVLFGAMLAINPDIEPYQKVTWIFCLFTAMNWGWEYFQYYYGENRINSHGSYAHTMDYDFRDILVRWMMPIIEIFFLLSVYTRWGA